MQFKLSEIINLSKKFLTDFTTRAYALDLLEILKVSDLMNIGQSLLGSSN